jgi:eukaryotic-like serine/threonine-protein kinase
MKKGNKIAVIIVLILVVLFGVGQFFAASLTSVNPATQTSPTSTDTTTEPPAIPATQVVAYVPPVPSSSTPTMSGSCWTNSIAAPYRTDAWRCTVGNSIQDPCFVIPGSTNLLCGVNPAEPDATSTFVLKLTQPLPAAEPIQGGIPSNWAWLVQLADGTLCSPFTGTRPFTASGQSANYACAPGPLGNNTMIFGDLNASSSVWMADVGTLSQSTSSLPTLTSSDEVPITEVWQ